MFSIFKRKYSSRTVEFGDVGTDMHSHLLPGIDDGSPNLEESIVLKKGLEDLGFTQFITTPHVMWDLYKNTPSTVSAAFAQLSAAGHGANIRPAAEYFMDDHLDQLVAGRDSLLTLQDEMVLVEFSFVAEPFDLKEKIFNLQIAGYRPVIAHPERYEYIGARKALYEDLKSMGCLFQVNLLSLAGYYGKTPSDLAEWLIQRNFVELVGTDLHHQRHLEALRNGHRMMPALKRLVDSNKLINRQLAA